MKNEFIVLAYPNGNLVGLDSMSGGYPFAIDHTKGLTAYVVKEVHIFPSEQKANDYIDMFRDKHFQIKKLIVEIR